VSRILIIEDNAALAAGIEFNLGLEGYEVQIAPDGRRGLALVREWHPDLVILDLMLPGVDGYEVLRAIRHDRNNVPVMILSARGEEADKVMGFRLDADQYVTKPFGVLELLERVGALLRRSAAREARSGDTQIRFGAVVVEPTARTVMRGGKPVQLSPKAFDLLMALVARGGKVVTRQELLREVWGYIDDTVMTRTVDQAIARLRKKIEPDPSQSRYIKTVFGVGYRSSTVEEL
jgi:DNA-binding response OmpR family regulator